MNKGSNIVDKLEVNKYYINKDNSKYAIFKNKIIRIVNVTSKINKYKYVYVSETGESGIFIANIKKEFVSSLRLVSPLELMLRLGKQYWFNVHFWVGNTLLVYIILVFNISSKLLLYFHL